MKIIAAVALCTAFCLSVLAQAKDEKSKTGKAKSDDGFVSIFNGKDLTGWKVNPESPSSIRAEDGMIIIDGKRTHAFYDGEVGNHDFKNFEFKAKVKTFENANSGIYFHTKYQESGWPSAGYECQVNNTHSDKKKTGGLYAVQDNFDEVAKDGVWFDYHIKVEGKHVVIKIDGKVITDYTEPENPAHLKSMPGRKIGSGTICLQAHDPKSVVHYKDLKLKILPDSK